MAWYKEPRDCSLPGTRSPAGSSSLSLGSDQPLRIFSHRENGLPRSHPQPIAGSWVTQITLCLSPTQTLFVTSDCPGYKVQTSQLTVGPSGFASLLCWHCDQRLHLPSGHLYLQEPAQGMPSLLALLVKLVILPDLRTTTLCLEARLVHTFVSGPPHLSSLYLSIRAQGSVWGHNALFNGHL